MLSRWDEIPMSSYMKMSYIYHVFVFFQTSQHVLNYIYPVPITFSKLCYNYPDF